jgi:hypothetical protein
VEKVALGVVDDHARHYVVDAPTRRIAWTSRLAAAAPLMRRGR